MFWPPSDFCLDPFKAIAPAWGNCSIVAPAVRKLYAEVTKLTCRHKRVEDTPVANCLCLEQVEFVVQPDLQLHKEKAAATLGLFEFTLSRECGLGLSACRFHSPSF